MTDPKVEEVKRLIVEIRMSGDKLRRVRDDLVEIEDELTSCIAGVERDMEKQGETL